MSDQIIEENNTNPSPLIPEENIIKNQTDNEPHPDTNSEDKSSITSEGNKLMKENLMKALRSKPQTVRCPYCGQSGETEVTRKCNKKNVICSIFTTPLFWLIFMCCRHKDYNCYDAESKCPKCHNILGDYHAC